METPLSPHPYAPNSLHSRNAYHALRAEGWSTAYAPQRARFKKTVNTRTITVDAGIPPAGLELICSITVHERSTRTIQETLQFPSKITFQRFFWTCLMPHMLTFRASPQKK